MANERVTLRRLNKCLRLCAKVRPCHLLMCDLLSSGYPATLCSHTFSVVGSVCMVVLEAMFRWQGSCEFMSFLHFLVMTSFTFK